MASKKSMKKDDGDPSAQQDLQLMSFKGERIHVGSKLTSAGFWEVQTGWWISGGSESFVNTLWYCKDDEPPSRLNASKSPGVHLFSGEADRISTKGSRSYVRLNLLSIVASCGGKVPSRTQIRRRPGGLRNLTLKSTSTILYSFIKSSTRANW